MKTPQLRSIREQRQVTQQELAVLARVAQHTIAYLENGREAHPSTVQKIAAALGVRPSDLMEQST